MTRPRAAQLLEKLTRIIPGIPGYQDREKRRTKKKASEKEDRARKARAGKERKGKAPHGKRS